MVRAVAVLVVLVGAVTGCASTAPPPAPSPVAARPFEQVRRVAIVVSGDSRFSVLEHSAEPGRTFDEIMKWNGALSLFRPLADVVHRGVNWLVALDRRSDTEPDTADVSPRAIVAEALSRTLQNSVEFDEIRVTEQEPVGPDRARLDAILRLTVPSWGLVRVHEGEPDLLSGFADVHAQIVLRGSGVVIWQHAEDVTGPERLPLSAFTRDRQFTRQHLIEVLERAGQRLGNELLYARAAGR